MGCNDGNCKLGGDSEDTLIRLWFGDNVGIIIGDLLGALEAAVICCLLGDFVGDADGIFVGDLLGCSEGL